MQWKYLLLQSSPICRLQPSDCLVISPIFVVSNCTQVFYMWFFGPLEFPTSQWRSKCWCLWCRRFLGGGVWINYLSQFCKLGQNLGASWCPCIEFILALMNTWQQACWSNAFNQKLLLHWHFPYSISIHGIHSREKGFAPFLAPSEVLWLWMPVW